VEDVGPIDGRSFAPPEGWRGACELRIAENDPTLA
jgi:hypothetical protein